MKVLNQELNLLNLEDTTSNLNSMKLNFEELEEIVAPSDTKEFLLGVTAGVGTVGGIVGIGAAIAT